MKRLEGQVAIVTGGARGKEKKRLHIHDKGRKGEEHRRSKEQDQGARKESTHDNTIDRRKGQ